MKRRKVIKMGALLTVPAVFGGAGVANAQLCRPTSYRSLESESDSPPVTAYTEPLFIPPQMHDVGVGALNPPIDPNRHQRYDEFEAEKFYEQHIVESVWNYHSDLSALKPAQAGSAAGSGSIAWMYSGSISGQATTPGPTLVARYGEPAFVRRHNDLPFSEDVVMPIGYPAISTHLHNAHTASESDGYPMDFATPGEFWEHHYAMYYARNDSNEALASLWYHDHMIDFTATNVYAGLSGMAIFYDDIDSGDETDPSPQALNLPGNMLFGDDGTGNSLGFDISLILHDVRFSADGNPAYNVFDTDGHLGDLITVNRKVQPFMNVKRRKYRFRIYDGGPSRFYELGLYKTSDRDTPVSFDIIANDGNLLEEPFSGATSVIIGPANRNDIIVDFSQFDAGDEVEILNLMEHVNGQGATGRRFTGNDRMEVLQFRVVEMEPGEEDVSQVPTALRPLPSIPPQEVLDTLVHREWVFDHDMGLWTVNG